MKLRCLRCAAPFDPATGHGGGRRGGLKRLYCSRRCGQRARGAKVTADRQAARKLAQRNARITELRAREQAGEDPLPGMPALPRPVRLGTKRGRSSST